jgi:hypothetical protein
MKCENWSDIGTYVERPVKYLAVSGLQCGLTGINLNTATLLLFVSAPHIDVEQARVPLCDLLSRGPLALAFAGHSAKELFDLALEVQSNTEDHPHTMTYLYEDDWLESFFFAGYPSAERFDEWSTIAVLEVGPSSIRKMVASFVS